MELTFSCAYFGFLEESSPPKGYEQYTDKGRSINRKFIRSFLLSHHPDFQNDFYKLFSSKSFMDKLNAIPKTERNELIVTPVEVTEIASKWKVLVKLGGTDQTWVITVLDTKYGSMQISKGDQLIKGLPPFSINRDEDYFIVPVSMGVGELKEALAKRKKRLGKGASKVSEFIKIETIDDLLRDRDMFILRLQKLTYDEIAKKVFKHCEPCEEEIREGQPCSHYVKFIDNIKKQIPKLIKIVNP